MAFETKFLPLTIEDLPALSAAKKEQGWRFVQILGVNTDDGIDVQYTFFKDGILENHTIPAVKKTDTIPSITGDFLSAFVFENETHDLFGVNIEGIAIDFKGNFYAVSQPEPMTIISPAQKAAREKAAKIAAAKAAKENAGAKSGKAAAPADDMEAKLAAMDPEKAAKVRAALEAKKKKEMEAQDKALEEKLSKMDPEKAAKVRAALEAKKKAENRKEGE